ncbi:MAG: protein kinase domain-containing protein, partial [Henriciella sp.]
HEILQVLLDVARGLDAISTADIVHGDLSARNVIAGPNGASKITDFGLSCRVSDPTHSGGTPGYMAPEKSKKGEALSSLDVFSLGALICRMLTGKTPRLLKDASGNSLLETIKVSEDASALRKELCALANRAIDPDPDKRPGTALLLHSLEVVAAGVSEEGRDQLAENVTQLMAERRVDAVLDPIEAHKVTFWNRWGSFTVSVALVFIAGVSALFFYANPNLPALEDVAIEMDLSVTTPDSFSADWVQSQIMEGVQDRWADWDIFDTESLHMEILCRRSLCELLLQHADRRGSHVHVTSISSELTEREDVWQGAIRDLVYLAASG